MTCTKPSVTTGCTLIISVCKVEIVYGTGVIRIIIRFIGSIELYVNLVIF